jgi:hypothetical protein
MDSNTPLPQTWDDLVALKDTLNDASRTFLRLDDELNDYKIFCEVIPKDVQIELILRQMGERDSAILVNRFPYSRLLGNLPNVKHWSLWSKSGAMTDEEIKLAVETRFPNQRWIAVESAVKSMPEIWHTHVFVEHLIEK